MSSMILLSILSSIAIGLSIPVNQMSVSLPLGMDREGSVVADSISREEVIREARSIGTVNSLLIETGDDRIVESYFRGMSVNRDANIKSASKSILSLLVGIALDEGFLESIDQTLGDFFPDYFDSNPDSLKESITLKQMLTMRTGLETTSSRNYGRWVISDNWVRFVLDQPIVEDPGGRMVYSTGTSHLISVILTRETGMSTREFANRYLFGPMDIRVGGWDRDPQGYYMGGNNMALRPADMAKIGRMVMNLGEYNGTRIVSREWLLDSFKIYTRSNYNSYKYGYMWWRDRVADYYVIFAWGNGGQYIMMLPELDTVVAITSGITRSGGRGYQREIFRFLEQTLIPFLERQG
ncbi:MAG: serine hydrolase [Balneolaceae bacterium]